MTREQFAAFWDTWQVRYIVWWAYGLAVIEIADVILRKKGIPVELVSMTVRRLTFSGLTVLVFFLASMTVHWTVTWHRATWTGTTAVVLGLLFWAVFVAYLLASWFDPKPRSWPLLVQWLRYPPIVALIGGVLAYVCLPQESAWFPGRPG